MRPSSLLVLAGWALGCGAPLTRIALDPVATTQSAAPPYAQVREVGMSPTGNWHRADDTTRMGVTVDVRNDGAAPITLALPGATLVFDSADGAQSVTARAIAGGMGGLPGRADLGEAPASLTVPPGASRTFWLVFDRVQLPRNAGVTLRLPAGDGEAEVRLFDPARGGPEWKVPPKRIALSVRIVNDYTTDREAFALPLVLSHTRGALRLELGAGAGRLYQRSAMGFERAETLRFEAGVAVRPPRWSFGFFAGGHLTHANFGAEASFSDRWSPGASVGLELPAPIAEVPFGLVRIGYVHVFDGRVRRKDGVFVSFDLRFFSW
jgi:hypothetical protein